MTAGYTELDPEGCSGVVTPPFQTTLEKQLPGTFKSMKQVRIPTSLPSMHSSMCPPVQFLSLSTTAAVPTAPGWPGSWGNSQAAPAPAPLFSNWLHKELGSATNSSSSDSKWVLPAQSRGTPCQPGRRLREKKPPSHYHCCPQLSPASWTDQPEQKGEPLEFSPPLGQQRTAAVVDRGEGMGEERGMCYLTLLLAFRWWHWSHQNGLDKIVCSLQNVLLSMTIYNFKHKTKKQLKTLLKLRHSRNCRNLM